MQMIKKDKIEMKKDKRTKQLPKIKLKD